jgi:hypothetical protein
MTTGDRMAASVAAGRRLWRASWIDRLHARVERWPGPIWLPYLVAWVVLAAAETLGKWATGAYPVGTFFPFHLVAMGTAVYGLGFLHVLDAAAERALETLRPSLDLSDAEVEDVRHRLTTMPELGVVLAMSTGAAYGALQMSPLVAPSLSGFRFAGSGPLLYLELFVMGFVLWGVVATFLYHAVRQLHIIDSLYCRHAVVDLFDARPLTTFSTYSAIMSIGIVLKGYLWVAAYPREAGPTAYGLQVMIVVLLFAVSGFTFFRPIWSGHGHLADLKRQRLQACHGALDDAGRDLRAAVAADDYPSVGAIQQAVAGVTAELARVEKASTWPWQGDALSRVLTAVLLPLVVWAVQQLVSAALLS